jgi:hypothetical protein
MTYEPLNKNLRVVAEGGDGHLVPQSGLHLKNITPDGDERSRDVAPIVVRSKKHHRRGRSSLR